jgi:hypothetical protein
MAVDRDPAAPSALPPAWSPDAPDFEARVLRAFVRDGRLVSLPAQQRKRLVVYRHVLGRVLPDPGELVQERDLNMRLALLFPDPATLRRALVDTGLARREGMVYWRAVPPAADG